MIGLGLCLDIFAGASASLGVIWKGQASSLCGDRGKLLDDVKKNGFVLARELPAIGDRAGQDLLGRPIVGGGGVRRRCDGNGRGLLGRSTDGYGDDSEAECEAMNEAHGIVPFTFVG
jgi:hypothetical protein